MLMRLPFFNRDNEKAGLEKALSSSEGTFCCLYGRRRRGKSRLLQEILPGRRAVYYVGDDRESSLQRVSLASAIARQISGFDRVGYPDWASLFERWRNEGGAGAVLVLDEFPYLVGATPELPSVLQRFVDQNRTGGKHLVVCGSSQSMMQGLVLDATAPLYGRAREILHIKPLEAGWIRKGLRLSHPNDLLPSYSVWGGIPRYWELAGDKGNLWTAVEELVLDPQGVLHNEPRRLLLDDMRDAAQASSILSLIGGGCHRMSEIASRLGKPATSLARPLQRLLELGFVRKEQPFGAEQRQSKKTLYRIDDPFLTFWFRFVEPNRSRLGAGAVRQVSREVKRDFPHHCGAIWEELVRRALVHLNVGGSDWNPGQRWWGAGVDRTPLELDVVASSTDGASLIVGETMLSLDPEKLGIVERELEGKIDRLPYRQEYERVYPCLFVADEPNFRKKHLFSARQIFSLLH
jgi:AAA+ ATPase superfamily predicted ATPase